MRLTKAGRAAVEAVKELAKKLKAENKELKADGRRKDRIIATQGKKITRLEGVIENMRVEHRKYKRQLRYHEGPSAPGAKNRADRKRDGEAKKRERERDAGEEGAPGGKKRRPGAQEGHKAHKREYRPTRRVVIDRGNGRACGKEGCDGELQVTGYARKIMVEKKP